MANSYQEYTGDGATVQFSFTKPYLRESHVQVFIDGVEDTNFTFVNSTLVQTSTTPGVGETVRVQRTTPTTPIVDWEDGSTVREEDQDDANLQSLYIAEESADNLSSTLQLDTDNKWDADSKIIKNVADGVDAQDAATKAQLDAAVLAAGNVPTPSDPGDDNKVLAASGGSFSWTSFVVSMISDAAAFMKTFLLSSTAAIARTNLGLGALATKATVATADIDNSAVTTAKINDDAVTLAKLAAGTDGELITWDASGDPAAVAVGTSGQVLTSNGVGAAPTFQDAGGSDWVEIEDTGTLSGVGLYSFATDWTTYRAFRFVIKDSSHTNGTARYMYLRVEDDGSTVSSNVYHTFNDGFAGNALGSTLGILMGTIAAANEVSGWIEMGYDATLNIVHYEGYLGRTDGSTAQGGPFRGIAQDAIATLFDGVTIAWGAGNFDGGSRIIQYGLPK